MQNESRIKLAGQLSVMENRWKSVHFAVSAGYALVVLILALLAGAVIDYYIALSMIQRLLLTITCYSTVLSYAWFGWIHPYLTPLSPRKVAWMLESTVPDFNEKLISAVELADSHDAQISMELINSILIETETDLFKVKPDQIFPLSKRHFVVPVITLLLFLAAFAVPSLRLGSLLKRVAFPVITDATVGTVNLSIVKPLSCIRAENEPINFTVECSDRSIRDVELCIEDPHTRRFVMEYDKKTKLFRFKLDGIHRSFRYWAKSGAARSKAHEIRIVKRPKIEKFIISYKFPAHTGLLPSTTESTSGDLKAYRGTEVKLEIKASKQLDAMSIKWMDREKQELVLDSNGTAAEMAFSIDGSGTYLVFLRDTDGLMNVHDLEYSVTSLEDKPPVVILENPKTDLSLTLHEAVNLKWKSEDDFGIKKQELLYNINSLNPTTIKFKPDATGFNWPLETLKIKFGDEIEYFVRAYDTSGQYTDSDHLRFQLIRGYKLKNASQFFASAEILESLLKSVDSHVAASGTIRQNIQSALDYPGSPNADNLEYNRTLLRQHSGRITSDMKLSEEESDQMKDLGFFQKSKVCCDLTSRYIQQERRFTAPDIALENKNSKTIVDLDEMTDLTLRMTKALSAKGYQHVAWAKMGSVVNATETLKSMSPDDAAVQRKRLRERMLDTVKGQALQYMPEECFGEIIPGLRGCYYDGINRIVQPSTNPGMAPSNVRTNTQFNFPNIGSFTMPKETFAATWSGFIEIKDRGEHQFFMNSDDGSMLYIDGVHVINNDGSHGPQERNGKIYLEQGLHVVNIMYFNSSAEGTLSIYWQKPGGQRELLPESVLFVDHPGALRAQMVALETELGRNARDYHELNEIASLIRKKLRSLEEQIDRVADELDVYDRKNDQDKIENLSHEMREEKENIPPEEQKIEKEMLKDRQLAADAMDAVMKKKDTDNLRKAAEHMAVLEDNHELKQIEAELEKAADTIRQALAELKENKTGSDKTALDNIEAAAEDLRRTMEMPRNSDSMDKQPDTKKPYSAMEQTAKDLERIAEASETGNTEQMNKMIEEASRDIGDALTEMQKAMATSDRQKELAMSALENMVDRDPSGLAEASDNLERMPDAVKSLDPMNQDGIKSEADAVADLSDKLADAAAALEEEARQEIMDKAGDVARAQDKLAVAAAVNKANDEKLQSAIETLKEAAELDTESNALLKKLARNKDEKKRAEMIDEAGKMVAEAAAQVDKANDLLQQAEAGRRNELSESMKQQAEAAMDQLAAENLSQEQINALGALDELRKSREQAEALADDVDSLENENNRNAQKKKSQDLAQDAKQIGDELTNAFTPERTDQTEASEQVKKEKPVNLDNILDNMDRMKNNLIEAEAARNDAKTIAGKIKPLEADAVKLLDELTDEQKNGLNKNESQRIEQMREKLQADKSSPAENAAKLNEAANMLENRNPELKEKLKAAANELSKNNNLNERMKQQENSTEQLSDRAKSEAGAIEKAIERSADPAAMSASEKLGTLEKNLENRDIDSARGNASAINNDIMSINSAEDEAAGNDKDQLVNEGIEDLKKAMGKASEKDKKLLQEAMDAARDNRLKDAAKLASQASEGHKEEAGLAENLENAQSHQAEGIEPLERALTEAKRNRFNHAAAYASQSPNGEEMSDMLKNTEKMIEDAARKAFSDSNAAPNDSVRNQLADAALRALADDLNAAIASANNAGDAGQASKQALENARKSAENSVGALEQELDKLKNNNAPAKAAENDLNSAKEKLAREKQAADSRGDNAAANEAQNRINAMNDIGNKMNQKQFAQAADAAQQAAMGAVEAGNAADKFAEASALPDNNETADAQPQYNLPEGGAAEKVDAAISDLKNAQENLGNQDAAPAADAASQNADSAAQNLMDAEAMLEENVLAMQDSQDGEPAEGEQLTGSRKGGGQKGKGHGSGKQGAASTELDKSWDGADGSLDADDSQGQKVQYNSYYRKANRQYMEKINRAGKNNATKQ